MVEVAFYVGNGTFQDRLVRVWTMSQTSHVEVIIDNESWYGASPREGGVRKKKILYKKENWIRLPLEKVETDRARAFLECQVGKKYDYLGIYLSQIIPASIENPKRWFCSELYMALLKDQSFPVGQPQSFSPGKALEYTLRRFF